MILVIGDTHLDDNPANEYRWKVCDHIREAQLKYKPEVVLHLGDAWDRKDRFTGEFVNRLIFELGMIGGICPLLILKGNHDHPLHGPAFFEFINGRIPKVTYVTKTTTLCDKNGKGVKLIPFSLTMRDDLVAGPSWEGLHAGFTHLTVHGSISESGFELKGFPSSELPQNIPFYSGDVHNPQTIRNLTYVGCPHPIKYGDKFTPRMLLLDDDYEIAEEIILETMSKRVIQVSSIEELQLVTVAHGDMARIKINLDTKDIDRWGSIEAAVAKWAEANKVDVTGLEAIVQEPRVSGDVDAEIAPETILNLFADEEGISDELVILGQSLLAEAKA